LVVEFSERAVPPHGTIPNPRRPQRLPPRWRSFLLGIGRLIGHDQERKSGPEIVFSTQERNMASRKTSLVLAALVVFSAPAFAQGAGSGAGGAAASSGTGTGGSAATSGGTNQPTANSQTQGTAGANTPNPSSAPAGSPTALQAQRNAGAGTAPNGLPIGTSGSGIGSPEHPVDSGTR